MKRALDLFCGAGGATKGLQRAGYHVTGVDIKAQPRYCGDEFHQADAMTFPLDGYDLIWASPPCQAHVQWNGINRARNGSVPDHPELIASIRERLRGRTCVIENVIGAPLINATILCGTMFGLGVLRHRKFESSHLILRPTTCHHTGNEIGVYGNLDGRRLCTRKNGTDQRAARTLEQAQEAMGIDWMNWNELKESIPPAYSQFIAEQIG